MEPSVKKNFLSLQIPYFFNINSDHIVLWGHLGSSHGQTMEEEVSSLEELFHCWEQGDSYF